MDRPDQLDPFLSPEYRPRLGDVENLKEQLEYYEFRVEILEQQELEFIQSEKQVINGMTWKDLQAQIAENKVAIRVIKEHIQATESLAIPETPKKVTFKPQNDPPVVQGRMVPAAAGRSESSFWPDPGASINLSTPPPIPRSQRITEPIVLSQEQFFERYIRPYRDLLVTCNGVALEHIAPIIPKEFFQAGLSYLKLIKKSYFSVMECHANDGSIDLTFQSAYKSSEPREDGITATVRDFCREIIGFLRSRQMKAEMEIRFDRADTTGYLTITATRDMATVLCLDPFVEEVITADV